MIKLFLLTAKIGEGPKKNFPPRHKKGIGVRTPSGYLDEVDPDSSGVHPASILAQQCGQEPKILTRTHSKIKPGYNRASYGPRKHPNTASYGPCSTPTRSSTDHLTTKLARYPPTAISRMLTRCRQPAKAEEYQEAGS